MKFIKDIIRPFYKLYKRLIFLLLNPYYNKLRKKYINKDFILSDEFEDFVLKKVDNKDNWEEFLNDAEKQTDDFIYRHKKINNILGTRRWKGIIQNKHIVGNYVFDKELKGLDFGGAYGPISLEVDILDMHKKDIFGRKVKYNNIDDIDEKFDYIFSSHTLEHLSDIESFFEKFKSILKANGTLILNLPSFSCVRWRAGVHKNNLLSDHKYTFKLSETNNVNLNNLINIDNLVNKYFDIDIKKYTGDDSIFLLAKNN